LARWESTSPFTLAWCSLRVKGSSPFFEYISKSHDRARVMHSPALGLVNIEGQGVASKNILLFIVGELIQKNFVYYTLLLMNSQCKCIYIL
jgi:hypothetical protein